MWKKEDEQAQKPVPRREDRPNSGSRTPVAKAGERATIGRSISIKGEVTGDEDLLIQGRINGSVNLKQHSVTVGPDGEVQADIIGRVVTVEGHVEGNLRANDQIVLRSSAWVQGDITAPRVMLEDGAHFRGSVDMGDAAKEVKETEGEQALSPAKEVKEFGNKPKDAASISTAEKTTGAPDTAAAKVTKS